MPELPEVETIKNQLSRLVGGKKIGEIKIFLPKIVKFNANRFKKIIGGATINEISRRAKILIFELNNSWTVLIHLKMTGQLIYKPTGSDINANKHTHLIFGFADGSSLIFNDLRQFGYIKLTETKNLPKLWIEEKFGFDALDKKLTGKELKQILIKKSHVKIKQFLMNQKNIAGIGNIYSNEILFYAGVYPSRRVDSLTETEIAKIHRGIKKILNAAIKARGTSADDYLDVFGQKGEFFRRLKVYDQQGKKCGKCRRGIIKKIKISGRASYFCPICQPTR